ncbi:MAG: hypothetical protein COW63_15040 [Bacteroidetes bacterium CG18_big_fil_WC_8_21_14_2_50_41_14]|nr:MAG: hypothetical protein COW63_15040 [Bacteroidetes bacterium CG18_big_fil_WC_8_21_14_2_50_41_14]PJB59809.1 MAG: hypothetical protein CO098_01440 [Bacteroidetes bacterium CG_4_9_14_3_um_filter_41_19]
MKKTFILTIIFLVLTSLNAQTVTYDDVAVIVNDNSQASIEIGNYFKEKRSIPEVNMIHINCSTDERVDSTEARSLINQVSNYLTSNNIASSINYLVTTKGVPYIYDAGNCDTVPGFWECSPIDQELTMVINHEENILSNSVFNNPYYDTLVPEFIQEENTFYLVTRLDAYTVDEVKTLIDRSGPDIKVDMSSAQFVFDVAFASDTSATSPFVFVIQRGNEFVQSKGWNSIYDPESGTFITEASNVLAYYSFLFQPSNKVLNFQWLRGSIAFLGMSSSAFTFLHAQNPYNDLILADLIAEGACGGIGFFGPYFMHAGTIWPEIVLNKYTYGLDTIRQSNLYFNLAESYYQSISRLPSVQIIVGDPKTSIVLGDPNDINEYDRIALFKAFPNPADANLTIEYEIKENTPVTIKLYSLFGTRVYQHNESAQFGKQSHKIDVSNLPKGLYIIELETNGLKTREKIMIR